MADLQGWGMKLKYMARSVDSEVNKVLKRATMAVVEELVYATPVDTGRARSSWRTGIGRQKVGVPYKSPKKPPSPALGALRSIDEARDAISKITIGSKTVYITSNLEYMGELNRGTSTQASAGFVERAIIRGRNSFQKELPKIWKAMK